MSRKKIRVVFLLAICIALAVGSLVMNSLTREVRGIEVSTSSIISTLDTVLLLPTSVSVIPTILSPPVVDAHSGPDNLSGSPIGDFAHMLPNYPVGERVDLGAYKVKVIASWDMDNRLVLNIALENDADHAIDTGWAFQLYNKDGMLIRPTRSLSVTDVSKFVQSRTSLTLDLAYDLGMDGVQMEARGYDLLFAPKGWSGPVIFFVIPLQDMEKP